MTKNKLALIIPFRNREKHLKQLLPILFNKLNEQRDEFSFSVFVVEQSDGKLFNTGLMKNIGALKAMQDKSFDYFCFQDVDTCPVEADYSFPDSPCCIVGRSSIFLQNQKRSLPYDQYFGGAVLINKEHLIASNGYANFYWGWGAEDDDFFARCIKAGATPSRRNGYFENLPHERHYVNSSNTHLNNIKLKLFEKESLTYRVCGLNSVPKSILESIVVINCQEVFENIECKWTHLKVKI